MVAAEACNRACRVRPEMHHAVEVKHHAHVDLVPPPAQFGHKRRLSARVQDFKVWIEPAQPGHGHIGTAYGALAVVEQEVSTHGRAPGARQGSLGVLRPPRHDATATGAPAVGAWLSLRRRKAWMAEMVGPSLRSGA
jgi:hypothetical protein